MIVIKKVNFPDFKVQRPDPSDDRCEFIADTGERTILLQAKSIGEARRECAAIFSMSEHEFDVQL